MAKLPTWSMYRREHTALAEALLACNDGAHPGSVHQLRRSTRRLGAVLDVFAGAHPKAKTLHKDIEKAQRAMKRLRGFAGATRDLDVHRKLLVQLRKTGLDPSEIDTLDEWLKQHREGAAGKLESDLTHDEEKLQRALHKIEEAMQPPFPTAREVSALIRQQSKRAFRREVSHKDLHDVRKATKGPRYLGEMLPASASTASLTKQLKAMQDRIGTWHDWELLADESRRALGKKSPITRWLVEKCDSCVPAALLSAQHCHETFYLTSASSEQTPAVIKNVAVKPAKKSSAKKKRGLSARQTSQRATV